MTSRVETSKMGWIIHKDGTYRGHIVLEFPPPDGRLVRVYQAGCRIPEFIIVPRGECFHPIHKALEGYTFDNVEIKSKGLTELEALGYEVIMIF